MGLSGGPSPAKRTKKVDLRGCNHAVHVCQIGLGFGKATLRIKQGEGIDLPLPLLRPNDLGRSLGFVSRGP